MAHTIESNNARYAKLFQDIFPESVKQVNFAVIDMDVTRLSVADILRNVDRNFPKNSSARNAIANGNMAVAILCKTELLKPLSGLIIVICDDGEKIHIRSKDYVVLGISECTISFADNIMDMLDKLTTYLIQNYGEIIPSFDKFYTLYVYDAYELEGD